MSRPAAGDARLAALRILQGVLDKGLNLSEAEPEASVEQDRERAFARHLSYGTLRWLSALQWLANGMLRHPFKRKDRDIHRLVLLGLFQLWQDETAAHAAINETAEVARKLGKPWAVGVINAVLRRFQRERSDWLNRLENEDARYAHPRWLLEAFRSDWPQYWQPIAEENNRAAPFWLRLNGSVSTSETCTALQREGFEIERHPLASNAVRVQPAVPVNLLPGFSEGRISVQDPAAQLAVDLLRPEEGSRVLDACAAPGGKTCHILECCPDLELTALDRSPERLERVRENLDRIGKSGDDRIRMIAADATDPDSWWDGVVYDRILLDAPCTATGVIRRHPEIKWLRTEKQVKEAAALQALLLDRLWPLLDPAGMLLYATCSVLRDENSLQIKGFLERTAGAELLDLDSTWGHDSGYGRQILPGEQDMDGFFYAGLRKRT